MNRIARALVLVPLTLALAPAASAYPGANGEIVYQRFYKGGSEIFATDPATGQSHRLTSDRIRSGDSISAGDPSFSPDGRRVVFINAVKRPDTNGRRNNLFTVRADGSRPRQLTSSSRYQYNPVYSPDGSEIAFGVGPDIHLIDADGSNERNLTGSLDGFAGGTSYAPDGSRIALHRRVDGGQADVWTMAPDGTDPVNLTPDGAGDDYQPAYSPDGSRIAFISTRVDFHGDLYVMNADGTGVEALHIAPPGVEVSDPAFSPDGTKIVFTSRRSSRAGVDVFKIELATGAVSALRGIRGTASDPDWGVATG